MNPTWKQIRGKQKRVALLGFFRKFQRHLTRIGKKRIVIGKDAKVLKIRPFPHPGAWCLHDELVLISIPYGRGVYKFTLRIKWWNLNDRLSNLKPERILSRALSESRIMRRVRARLQQYAVHSEHLTGRGSIIPIPQMMAIHTQGRREHVLPAMHKWESIVGIDTGVDRNTDVVIRLFNGEVYELPPVWTWNSIHSVTSYTTGVESYADHLEQQMARTTYEAADDAELRNIAKLLVLMHARYPVKNAEERRSIHRLSEIFILQRVTEMLHRHPAIPMDLRREFYGNVEAGLCMDDQTELPLTESWGDFHPANLLRDSKGRIEPTDPQTAPEWPGYSHPGVDVGMMFSFLLKRSWIAGNPAFRRRAFRFLELYEQESGIKGMREAAARRGLPIASFVFFKPGNVEEAPAKIRMQLFTEMHRMIREGTCGNE